MSHFIVKKLLRKSAPTLLSQLLINANAIFDTLMMGHVSAAQQAFLGVGMNIYISLYVPFMGILLTLIPLMSGAHSEKKPEKVMSLFKQGTWLALFLSFISILIFLFPGSLLAVAKSEAEFNHFVKSYLIATSFGMPAILLFQVYFAFFMSMLRPKFVVYINIISFLLKGILNVVLIFWVLPKEMGAIGCAIATSTVSWMTIGVAYWFAQNSAEFAPYRKFKKMVSFNLKEQWQILKLGIPVGIAFSIDSVFFTLMTLLVTRFGALSEAANQIVATLSYTAYLIPLSIAHVSTTMIAEKLSAKKEKVARIIGVKTLQLGFFIYLTLTFFFIFFNKLFAGLATADTQVLPLASTLIILMGIYRFFDSFLTMISGMLRGYQKTLVPSIIYGVTLWPIGFGLGYYLTFHSNIPFFKGPAGFWFALIFSASCGSLMLFAYYQKVSLRNSHHPAKEMEEKEASIPSKDMGFL